MLVLALPLVPLPSGAATSGDMVLYLDAHEQATVQAPGPDASTLVRYDSNNYPFVAAQPIEWTFVPETDLHLVGFGGSIWFRSDATQLERDLAPARSAYEIGIKQGDDPILVHGTPAAGVQGDSDNPVFPPFTPSGDYRVEFPMTDVDVRFVAGEPITVRVLMWTTNFDLSGLANDGTFLHEMLDSDLAVLYGSQERSSRVDLMLG